ncbi:MAG: ABC transporter permease [Bacteroidota bacterium]
MKVQKPTPPKLADWLLAWVCSEELLEEILGDLHEYFYDLTEISYWKRSLLYWFHVINFLRPFAIKRRKFQIPLINHQMFSNHLVLATRLLKKSKLFAFINILALSISMSVGILMILFLSDIYSFDDFQVHKDQIYRINTHRVQGTQGREVNLITSSYYIGSQLRTQVPGIERVLIMDADKLVADLKSTESAVAINGRYVSSSFFEVFSYKLLKGDSLNALSAPNGIVLTESISKKLFGDADPMGQTIIIEGKSDKKSRIVTGVVEDPPLNAHLQFEVLLSLHSLDQGIIEGETDGRNEPNATGDFYVYLLLAENTIKENVESAMVELIADHNASLEHPIRHTLQPMNTFVTSDIYYNEVGPRFPQQRVYIMMGLTLLILLSACFNYANLSLARALRRSKEVGIRKIAGANRFQIFYQFITEAVVIAFLAFVVALGLFFLMKPEFLNIQNLATQGQNIFSLDIDSIHIIYFLLFAIAIGVIAGFFPALLLSKFSAGNLFEDTNNTKLLAGNRLKRTLNILQFALSISLVMAATLVYKQYEFSLNFDLGYRTEDIVNIPINGDYIELLESEYSHLAEVRATAKSSMVIGIGGDGLSGGMIRSEGQEKPRPAFTGFVDKNFLEMQEFKLLAGKTFLDPLVDGGNTNYIVANEGLLKELALGTPQEAIGKTIFYNEKKVRILGVVKDFIDIGLTKKIFNSFVFVFPDGLEQYRSLAVKLRSNNLPRTIQKLDKIYQTLDPIHPFEFHFYDDQLANNYRQQKVIYKLISYLAIIAVGISILGMLGMAVLTTESRIKEISIRKVLGAGVANLMLLLSRGFLVLILLAGLIAIPTTLYLVNQMVLNEFLYKAEIGLIEIFSGFAIVLAIGVLTIGWQIRMAAIKNPVDLLRTN